MTNVYQTKLKKYRVKQKNIKMYIYCFIFVIFWLFRQLDNAGVTNWNKITINEKKYSYKHLGMIAIYNI